VRCDPFVHVKLECIEHGYVAVVPTAGSCGDGYRMSPEQCDDGNAVSGDGCSSTCREEAGYWCRGGGVASADTCAGAC